MKTCENCEHGVVWDRSLPIEAINNLSCGYGLSPQQREHPSHMFTLPTVTVDHTCSCHSTSISMALSKAELTLVHEEVEADRIRLVHPWAD